MATRFQAPRGTQDVLPDMQPYWQAVNDAIRSLKLTRIIIAHRPETIASAERVIVLQGGRVAQDLRRAAA